MYYPTAIYKDELVNFYKDDGSEFDETGKKVRWIGPSLHRARAEIPSFFEERSFGEGNDVCHIKCLSLSLRPRSFSPSAPYEIAPEGFFRNNQASPDSCWVSRVVYGEGYYRYYNVRLQRTSASETRMYVIIQSRRCQPGGKPDSNNYSSDRYSLSVGMRYVKGTIAFVSGWQPYNEGYSSPTFEDFKTYTRIMLPKRYFDTGEISYSYVKEMVDFISAVIDEVPAYVRYRSLYYESISLGNLPNPATLQSALLLSEYDLIFNKGVGEAYAAYHMKAARQAAYLDALDKVPQMNDNNLSNILEIVSFMKGIIIDHRVEIPKSLASAWLAYRYQYTTTKLDVNEAVSFVNRYVDKDFLVKGFSCYGRYSFEYKGVPMIMKCHLSMKQKELALLEQAWTALYRYGLTPSFYVIWDMLPYSFIVDWFIPIGDILDGYDKTSMYDREYEISNIWYSLSYETEDESGNPIHAYTRWGEESSPGFQGYYTLENKGTTSTKVIGFRILDALSLIFS